MATTTLERAHQRNRDELAAITARAVLREWERVDPDAIAANWGRLLPRVTRIVQSGQRISAEYTNEFMASLLDDDERGPDIDPAQFAVSAPDGRPLEDALAQPIPRVIQALKRGVSKVRAKAMGAHMLQRMVRTIVADSGRQADQASMTANRHVTGYIRIVEPGACSRCIILAGNVYHTSTGFQRHPECQCIMRPVTRKLLATTLDPEEVYAAMTPEQRHRRFGAAAVKAIEDGARMSSVVNARKGMSVVEMHGQSVIATYTGTGRGRKKRPPRLMPEEIYHQAGDDREMAIRLLHRNGYLR